MRLRKPNPVIKTPDKLQQEFARRMEEFNERLRKLGFRQTEAALLFGCTCRNINYYMTGRHSIPTKVWVRLDELEKIKRSELCETVLRERKRKQKHA